MTLKNRKMVVEGLEGFGGLERGLVNKSTVT